MTKLLITNFHIHFLKLILILIYSLSFTSRISMIREVKSILEIPNIIENISYILFSILLKMYREIYKCDTKRLIINELNSTIEIINIL